MANISVVIAVYNGAPFLREALESVAAQSFLPFEIIIVDDGSTDRTKGVVSTFSSAIPVSYHHQQNQGAGAARNRGVVVAQGEWIAFLDADDVWFPHKLAVQIEHVGTHPESQFVYSNVLVTDDTGRPARIVRQEVFEPLVFDGNPFAQLSTVLMRKDLFTRVGGFLSSLRLYEDLELYARLARLAPMEFIAQNLATYRLHPAQSTKDHGQQTASWLALMQTLEEGWRPDKHRHAFVHNLLVRFCEEHSRHHLYAWNFPEAQQYGVLAFRYSRSWKNLRRLVASCVPGLRNLYYGIRPGPQHE